MPTKKQKQAVIRQLLIPIFLIIAALLYQPVKGLFVSKEKPVETKADPAYAVISAGKDNSYGHPHAATLAKLEDDDVQIYRTDTMGTIEAVSDGNQIHMETEKGKTNE